MVPSSMTGGRLGGGFAYRMHSILSSPHVERESTVTKVMKLGSAAKRRVASGFSPRSSGRWRDLDLERTPESAEALPPDGSGCSSIRSASQAC